SAASTTSSSSVLETYPPQNIARVMRKGQLRPPLRLSDIESLIDLKGKVAMTQARVCTAVDTGSIPVLATPRHRRRRYKFAKSSVNGPLLRRCDDILVTEGRLLARSEIALQPIAPVASHDARPPQRAAWQSRWSGQERQLETVALLP